MRLRFFQLRLRAMFVLILFAALGSAWWSDHRRQQAEIEKMSGEIERLKKGGYYASHYFTLDVF